MTRVFSIGIILKIVSLCLNGKGLELPIETPAELVPGS